LLKRDNNYSNNDLIKNLRTQVKTIPGSREDKASQRNKLNWVLQNLGTPTFFATFS